MTWSYSRITSFNDCKYGWFLRYIRHLKTAPQFYSSYGTFVHKILEQFYKGEITKDQMSIKFLFGFKEEVKGDRPSQQIVEKYIQRGLEYFNTFEPFPYNMIDVEKEVNFEIGGYPFVGYIDYLGEKDGDYFIVDNKSRDLKPRSNKGKKTANDELIDKMLRQLYIYSTGVKNEFGKFPKALCFNCYKAGTFIVEPFDEEKYKEAIEWATKCIDEILLTTHFPPNIDFFNCKYICGLGEQCCYWDGGKNLWKNKRNK